MSTMSRWQRMLLPGEVLDGPDGRRSARDRIVDVVLWILASAVGFLVLAGTRDDHSAWTGVADVALGAVALVLLGWRRTHADAVGAVTVALSAVSAVAGGAGLVGAFTVALRGSWRGVVAVAALSAVAVVAFPLLYAGGDDLEVELLVGALLTALVFGWGLLARVRREQLLALHRRAVRQEEEHRERLEQARQAERRRIAGEMHDVLAHRVSLLSLHAGALEFRPDAPPEEIARAAGVIRASAHAALEELSGVIGVLRDPTGAGVPPPQPTLADLPALVEEARAAGMAVTCRLDLPPQADPPAALGRTAYRVVQEGLTNARKHAPGAAVLVAVAAGDELVVEVLTSGPADVPALASELPGAGSGLAGLDERVALAGGTLWHGTDPAGGFVLRATLPWTP